MRRKQRRSQLSVGECNELWARTVAGDSLADISMALALSPSAVQGHITRRGGVAPRPRQRAAITLSLAEREAIARGLERRESAREIGRRLGRHHTTIRREIMRNGARTATSRAYDPAKADARAWARAPRPKARRLATHPALCAVVAAHLQLDWSPEQIAGWLVTEYPTDPTMRVSAETIYRTLYVQARGVLRQELTAHLRRGQSHRRPRARRPTERHGAIVDGMTIRDRPADVAARGVPGHWEGDLLLGGPRSAIATLVERQSRFVLLLKLPSKESARVVDVLIAGAQRIPTELFKSLTWDRGSELAQHQRFTVATDVAVYFCDPRSPWQRGTNENTNGLLRQYFPKGADLSHFSQDELDAIALRLNTRPRETLGFRTPARVFAEAIAQHGGASTG